MNLQDYQGYLLPLAVLIFLLWRFLKFKKVKAMVPDLLAKGAVVVDVRSPSEFRQEARPGSINIPLDELGSRINELDKQKMIILCCASGMRSGRALGILKNSGFSNVINAGPWTNTLV
jgi:phage shock protein E